MRAIRWVWLFVGISEIIFDILYILNEEYKIYIWDILTGLYIFDIFTLSISSINIVLVSIIVDIKKKPKNISILNQSLKAEIVDDSDIVINCSTNLPQPNRSMVSENYTIRLNPTEEIVPNKEEIKEPKEINNYKERNSCKERSNYTTLNPNLRENKNLEQQSATIVNNGNI